MSLKLFSVCFSFYVPSQGTIQFDITYENWETINGVISHNVTRMVTPAVLVSDTCSIDYSTTDDSWYKFSVKLEPTLIAPLLLEWN